MRTLGAIFLFCALTAISMPAQTLTSLLSFNGTDGQAPTSEALVQGLDGDLYGTTRYGGLYNGGTVFKINSAGTLTTLWNFCQTSGCPDGDQPTAGLTLVIGGNFYGTTSIGGTHGGGTVFKITPAGVLTTVYNFCAVFGCTDGLNPNGVILGTDGNLYGTTVHGGTGGCGGCHGGGIFFRLSLTGTLTNLHSFCTGTCLDGNNPEATPIQGIDGNYYGTAITGGSTSAGTVWKATPSGTVTTLYTFCSVAKCADGINPLGGLVQGSDGNFYGTTDGDDSTEGNVFKISSAGKFVSLYSFGTVPNDGGVPAASLIQGVDGNFYGTTSTAFHDANCCGTIFSISPAGTLTTLIVLNGTDGNVPYGLVQDTSGTFYGITAMGGTNNKGTAFSLSSADGQFVELVTNYGKAGKNIDILGQGLTGATAVSFDGVAATFKNISSTYLTATVPAGALTGFVTVTTFTGKVRSSQQFRVIPQITSFTPASATVGESVTITGAALTQTTKVTIGGKSAPFTVTSDTQLEATVPSGAKTGQKISIITPGGTASSSSALTIEPLIKSFTPTSGPVGTSVAITGNTFTGATGVTFGGVSATSLQVISDTQVDALVPTGAVTGPIAVTTPGGTATSTEHFTVTP
jgi:uncharacterized repeat protein (TIGR03803 family)